MAFWPSQPPRGRPITLVARSQQASFLPSTNRLNGERARKGSDRCTLQAARTTSKRGIHPLALLTDRVATRRGAAICLALSLLVAVAANLAASSLPAPKETIDSLPSLAPSEVVILAPDRTAGRDAATAARALAAAPGVAGVAQAGTTKDGRAAQLQLTLAGNPYAPETITRLPDLRRLARAALPGDRVLIDGETAASYDTRVASDRDTLAIGRNAWWPTQLETAETTAAVPTPGTTAGAERRAIVPTPARAIE